MRLLISISIFISGYFFIIGFFTVVERKVLGLLQSRRSVSRVGFFSFYHFFLDFLKIICKGLFYGLVFRFCFIILFLFYFLVIFIISLLAPLNVFSFWVYYGFIIFLLVDGGVVLFKVFFVNIFGFKFSGFSNYKMRKVYIFSEVLFLFIFFIIVINFSFLGESFFKREVYIYSGYFLDLGFLFLFLFGLFFFMLVFKILRVPFDYLEIESEFVGGFMLEFFGIIFSFWMLSEYILIFSLGIFISYLELFFFLGDLNICFLFLSVFLSVLVFIRSGLRVRFISIFFLMIRVCSFYLWICWIICFWFLFVILFYFL